MLGGLDYHSIAVAVKRALSGIGALVGGLTSTGKIILSGATLDEAQGADVASAATIDLNVATGNVVDVTGVIAITAITLAQGAQRTVRFTGALTLTNGASLVLPGGANITTAAGDYAIFRGYAAGIVRCVSYVRASGSGILVNPVVHANRIATQSIVNATFTKIQFNNEVLDTNNNFDPVTNFRFTPTVPGKYFVAVGVRMDVTAANASVSAAIYKNGAATFVKENRSPSISSEDASVNGVVDMNGSTDFLEGYVYQEQGAPQNLSADGTTVFFFSYRVAP